MAPHFYLCVGLKYKFTNPTTYLFSEPLFSLQSLFPPLDLRLVHVFIFLVLFLALCSRPVRVEAIIWRKKSKRNSKWHVGATLWEACII